MSKERQPNPYKGALIGEKRRLSEIYEKVPYVKPALDAYLSFGKLIGQCTLDNDTVVWSPSGLTRKQEEQEKAELGHRKKAILQEEIKRASHPYQQIEMELGIEYQP